MSKLSVEDCRFIITSLDYTVRSFQEYKHYPSYEFKLQRVAEAEAIRQKMRDLRDELKEAGNNGR
jgi:putative component of membrane protein insertase Oxa1/YidC/SpoIIIJ protein YidD